MNRGIEEHLWSATAYRAWDTRWEAETGRSDWLEPEKEVLDVAESLLAAKARRAVDLGCGVGRHAVCLASLGFEVAALERSESGLAFARAAAQKAGCPVDFQMGLMTDLPYADGSFDYVLAWNVIYHGDREVVRRCLSEIHRVLRRGGTFQATFLSKRNHCHGKGSRVAPDTFILDGVSDKAHPHFYCNGFELVELLKGFELISLCDREQSEPGSFHWHCVAERL